MCISSLARKRTTKIQLQVQFENLRQQHVRDGLTYEEWLNDELQGHAWAFPSAKMGHAKPQRSRTSTAPTTSSMAS